jgi:3-hydroxybutyryl-CoA dehydrogenase
MKLVFTTPKQGDSGFAGKCGMMGVEVIQVEHSRDFLDHPDADLLIDAGFNGYFAESTVPLLFHSPALTFNSLKDAPALSARFCGWPGFWERKVWEIASQDIETDWEALLSLLGVEVKLVNDICGLIAPRILCTIINEAVITINNGVAGAEEIDTAMKLGTNYPLGPIEWAKKIGFTEISALMKEMSNENTKYKMHTGLKQLISS